MDLSCTDTGDVLIVTVNETRIDAVVAIQFKDKMREVTNDGSPHVVLDLSQVGFVDSSGLGAIVASMKQLGSTKRLDLAGLTPTVDKVFRLTRMDSIFTIHDSAEQAKAVYAA